MYWIAETPNPCGRCLLCPVECGVGCKLELEWGVWVVTRLGWAVMMTQDKMRAGTEVVGDEDIPRALLAACKGAAEPVQRNYDRVLASGAILPKPSLRLRILRSVLTVMREWAMAVLSTGMGSGVAGGSLLFGGAAQALSNQGMRDKLASTANRCVWARSSCRIVVACLYGGCAIQTPEGGVWYSLFLQCVGVNRGGGRTCGNFSVVARVLRGRGQGYLRWSILVIGRVTDGPWWDQVHDRSAAHSDAAWGRGAGAARVQGVGGDPSRVVGGYRVLRTCWAHGPSGLSSLYIL